MTLFLSQGGGKGAKMTGLGKQVVPVVVLLLLGWCGCAVEAPPPRPRAEAEVRPASPAPNAVWVQGHWQWRSREQGYVWVPGHWKLPGSTRE